MCTYKKARNNVLIIVGRGRWRCGVAGCRLWGKPAGRYGKPPRRRGGREGRRRVGAPCTPSLSAARGRGKCKWGALSLLAHFHPGPPRLPWSPTTPRRALPRPDLMDAAHFTFCAVFPTRLSGRCNMRRTYFIETSFSTWVWKGSSFFYIYQMMCILSNRQKISLQYFFVYKYSHCLSNTSKTYLNLLLASSDFLNIKYRICMCICLHKRARQKLYVCASI